MNGQLIGYIRVSTFDQNPERQLDGVQIDRSFTDKASGKDVIACHGIYRSRAARPVQSACSPRRRVQRAGIGGLGSAEFSWFRLVRMDY